MAQQGDKIVISEKFKLALLAGIFGMSGTGALREDKVALELSKIREALLVAVEKVKDHDRRLDNLETLFLRPTR